MLRRTRPLAAVFIVTALSVLALVLATVLPARARTQKPPLHAAHWLAITGKPLAATAGAMMFQKGGNAVDAAAAMLAAACTMWDTLSWGGETQALIYNPKTGQVIALNALGVAPTGATPEFFRGQKLRYPPEYGPLAAVTPGTPGGLITMLAEWGRLSLADVLAPAIQMADGFPIEAQLADTIARQQTRLSGWPFSKAVFLPHADRPRQAPDAGEMFRQPDLARTLRRLVEAEAKAKAAGKNRHDAILSAYELFYKGDLARELVAAARAEGALWTEPDLANWRVKIEKPVSVDYKGIEVYKLDTWTQGPAMLQALNLLEGSDLKGMGYNSARYIHTVSQAMHMAFADRDFYYGDPAFAPEEPLAGLLSKAYAKERWRQLDPGKNLPDLGPGDPYPFQGGTNPFAELLKTWTAKGAEGANQPAWQVSSLSADEAFHAGTTSVLASDAEGWVVSMTPSGGWVPAVIAGKTGIGLSQRMQSFVTAPEDGPFNVVEPGKRPRVTLTPTLATKNGKPFLAFAVQGGDSQDQNLLQFFLDVVEFGMTVQESTEAANWNTYQMRSSFGDHKVEPGRLTLADSVSPWVRDDLRRMGYKLDFEERTSGPINAIEIDATHGTMWGGSSNHGEDYGIAW
ncbi:MAG TPA: gamma-glutamyltransferase [Thermoanaerobaculia bacterium]|jgi:gamma-glutamyltranspeptidase/glutathione hydrolase|nr:gamma-glutamyltransferase [Thermoanaerobaculia bacterium]